MWVSCWMCESNLSMRLVKIVAGVGLLAAGIAMLALPGPGWLTIAAGLAILADEFAWAGRLFDALRRTAASLGRKIKREPNGKEITESDRSSHH